MTVREELGVGAVGRWPSIAGETLTAICDVAEAQGGDREDAEDLLDTWARLHVVTAPCLDAMRREVADRRRRCADGSEAASPGRCGRCHGLTRERGR